MDSRFGLEGFGNLRNSALLQTHHGSHHAAEFEEVAARVSFAAQMLIYAFFFHNYEDLKGDYGNNVSRFSAVALR